MSCRVVSHSDTLTRPETPIIGRTSAGDRHRSRSSDVLTGMPTITLFVNRQPVDVDVDPKMPLLWALRDELDLIGTKFGCGGGFCGACTVHVDGVATRSCILSVSRAAGRQITTIEGLQINPAAGNRESGVSNREPGVALHPVQQAWLELDVPQCGYCQTGQMMTAAALLARTPNPSDDEIIAAMNGNICRCGTYVRIRQAVRRAAELNTISARGEK
jgi:isoquinoline 1-oxidoreductase subunit alpha